MRVEGGPGGRFGPIRLRPVVAAVLLSAFALLPVALPAEEGDPPFPGYGKIRGPSFLDALLHGDGTADIVVFLEGYRDLVGKVRSDDPAGMRVEQARIARLQGEILSRVDGATFRLRHRYENILALAGTATLDGLKALAAHPAVEAIEDDPMEEIHLAQGIALIGAGVVRSSYGGAGVAVGVTDSGIDYNHPMLGGGGFPNAKVIGGYDFWSNDADPMDVRGHGTGVAGIIAGDLAAGPGDYVGGVAPDAKLYALKVTNDFGQTNPSTQAAAWDWVVSHKYDDPAHPILVVNISLGGAATTADCDNQGGFTVTTVASQNLVANGVAMFASSGNSGYCDRIAHPACLSAVISVGAVFEADVGARSTCVPSDSCAAVADPSCTGTGGWACRSPATFPDLVCCYSNSAGFLDLLAPSDCAHTTQLGGGYTPCFNGTSAAAPYASGAAALVQSRAIALGAPPYAPEDLRQLLATTGVPVTDPKNGIVTPRIDLSNLPQPGRETACADSADNDGDTLTDCADPDCLVDSDGDTVLAPPCGTDCDDANGAIWAVPGEVTGLFFRTPSRLEWSDVSPGAGPGTSYQVLRGLLSGLPVGAGPGETCVGPSVTGTSFDDPVPPPTGDGFFYLVRAVNGCPGGIGTYGTDSSSAERTSGACP